MTETGNQGEDYGRANILFPNEYDYLKSIIIQSTNTFLKLFFVWQFLLKGEVSSHFLLMSSNWTKPRPMQVLSFYGSHKPQKSAMDFQHYPQTYYTD